MALGDPYLVLEYVGTAAFAVSGGAVAVRAGMDWLGVAVLAVVAAIGGGTLRDLLLGRLPRKPPDSRRVILVADAAGLAVFTVAGTQLALAAGTTGPVAVLLGVVTGTGGGVARDVLARQRPLILVGQIYALSAAAGATVFVVFTDARAPAEAARWTAIAVALILRLLAIRYSWSLPHLPARGARSADQPGAGA